MVMESLIIANILLKLLLRTDISKMVIPLNFLKRFYTRETNTA